MTVPHRITKRLGQGLYNVEHPQNAKLEPACECFLVLSLGHAKWVNYNMARGSVDCDHCKTSLQLPCPSVRKNWFEKYVYMRPEAIAGDLKRFGNRHQDCPCYTSPCPHGGPNPS